MPATVQNVTGDSDKHSSDTTAVQFYNDHVFSAGGDGKVKVWTKDLRLVKELTPHEAYIYAMAIDSKGQLYTSSCDGTIKCLTNPFTSDECKELLKCKDEIECLFVDPKDNLYSGDDKGIITQWINHRIKYKFNVVEQVRSMAIQNNIIYSIRDNDLTVTEIIEGSASGRFMTKASIPGRYPVRLCGGCSEDGVYKNVAILTRDGLGITMIRNSKQEQYPVTWTKENAHNMIINAMNAKDEYLYTAGYGGIIKQWSELDAKEPKLNGDVVLGSNGICINAIAIGADKTHVYAGCSDGSLQLVEFGITRLLLTQIPFYKEVVIMSFSCDHCGYDNNEIQPGGEIAPKGIEIRTEIVTPRDLNRRVVKSDFSSIRIKEIDFEIPTGSQKGEVTTVEGIIDRVVRGLDQDQPVRRIQHPEAAEQIDTFISKLQTLKELDRPFTLTISDISGNSFVENPNAPHKDPASTISYFQRTKEQNHILGIFTHEEVADKPGNDVVEESSKLETVPEEVDSLLKPIHEGAWPLEELQGEVLQFQTNCPDCAAPCDTNMKVTTVPHFKEVVIMATVCDNCGLRTNEVKPGGGIEEQGVKIEVTVRGRIDFARDVLKSESCSLHIRELECEVGAGALGGRFTTIEGLLTAIREQLVESTGMFMDSNDAETKERMDKFFGQLDAAIDGNKQLTIVMDDPTGNSYVQSLNDDGTPDTALRIIRYHRSHEQNEELGLNDMKTENYGEEETIEETENKEDC
uniref:Zinc finger ZPR1-type domain-containing protein n=1 Tax=Anopheles christyi TaxID=43041 RepID=A0A182JQ69_9DIPT